MNQPALTATELQLITGIMSRHPEITLVKLFGSRAKGTHTPRSDVDLAVWGEVDSLSAERVSGELDELPLPYRFEIQPFDQIKLQTLRDHIERVGIPIYRHPDHVRA
jgi:predicted nucleotidyltransferase